MQISALNTARFAGKRPSKPNQPDRLRSDAIKHLQKLSGHTATEADKQAASQELADKLAAAKIQTTVQPGTGNTLWVIVPNERATQTVPKRIQRAKIPGVFQLSSTSGLFYKVPCKKNPDFALSLTFLNGANRLKPLT